MTDMDEAYPWHCGTCHRLNKKVHTKCPNCHTHWSYGTRHRTEPKTVSAYQSSVHRDSWEAWDQDWKKWEKDQGWPAQRPHSASRPRTKSPRGRKGKGKASEAKGKDGKSAGDAFAAVSPFGPLAPSATPWPVADAATASSPFPAANTLIQAAQDVAAMAEALKEAYPDEAVRPQNVKDMIEKAERDAVKDVAKGLHSATKALSKAQKTLAENLDAKQQHKAQWAKHVGEAIQTWQGQLQSYRRQQTAFQEITNKAKQDIEMARNTIQLLNAKAANTGLATATPLAPKLEAEESSDIDKEEEKLKQSMQKVLQSCAQSLGLDLGKAPVEEVHEVKSDDETQTLPAPKRPRSLEPFPGHVASSMES